MQIIKEIKNLKNLAKQNIENKTSLGLIPTMGALHEGHISLIKKAKSENDKVIVSIFINPIQFSPGEDYKKYPRTNKKDIEILEKLKVNYLFLPSNTTLYKNHKSYVEVKHLKDKLCGKSRPNLFKGVATICTKLFNLTLANNVYFGQKDYQQYLIIKKLIEDLNINTKIKMLKIIRDKNGLALSSRNQYLNKTEKEDAQSIYQSLIKAKNLINQGEKDPLKIKNQIKNILSQKKSIKIDYISICQAETLEEIIKIKNTILIAIAIKINSSRLIDNILIET